MKTRNITLIALLLAVAFAGCNKPQEFSTGNPIHLSVRADVDQFQDTRVTIDPADSTKLIWEGNESIGIMIGDNNSKTNQPTTYSTQELKTIGGKKGVFEGNVNLGTYTTDNIKGIVYPYSEDAWIRYNSDLRIVLRVGASKQIQHQNNVLNGFNAPLFAEVKLEDFIVDAGNNYSIEDKKLQWGCSMFRFNIYGQFTGMNPAEVFKSVSITSISSSNLAGTYEWKIGQNTAVYNGISSTVETELEEACTIADKTQDNGVKVFTALLPRNTTFVGLKVVTDKATYTKTINYTSTVLNKPGTVLPVNVDLSTFDSRIASSAEPYSIDGGTTWKSDIPSASDNFTSLIAKGASLTLADLKAIAVAINSQAEPVDLDLSQSVFADGSIWPKNYELFTCKDSNPNTKLKSMKFPSNITSIADSAFSYCSKLVSVNLTGIKEIGANAFRNCHLTTLSIPNTVTTIGNQAFRWNFYLDSTYYNVPSATGTYILANNDATMNDNPENKKYVIVIGPDVQTLPSYFCRSNALVDRIIFESSPAINEQMLSRDTNLREIIFKVSTPPTLAVSGKTLSSSGTGTTTGGNIPAADKKIIVPAGAKAAFEASDLIQEIVGRGYTIVEAE